jgi:hypothetical protein
MNRLMMLWGIMAAYSTNPLIYADFVGETQSNFNVKLAGT